ncbi:Gfo/Idh/MocA family protein [Microvirga thermotolerans]|uniref:Gfo/Idh/MocA family oxidoreductase n=1 Tax=Microvirga thermotolerans TaxID=2651334 RepID=A0A5P9JSU6_9HYPH|nr:Gfo/Idh/MocA family oxidoreductase [Microvirga thermotolerans]QFU14848.1 gfo/Idh/MocA family oxidoreductase [Microvirga thermotolerans]
MTYGIGVVGLGIMGRRMIESFAANPDFSVVAGYDPAPVEAAVPRAGSVEALLADPAVRGVYIASPPATHEALVSAAARAGKAILCEKPLAASVESARACLAAVERAGARAAVNFPFATAPAAVRLGELVARGALGEELSAHLTVRFRTWPRGWQHGAAGWLAGPEQGGFTREVVSHVVLLALRLFGPGRLVEREVERGPAGTETRIRATVRHAACRFTIDGAVAGEIDDFNRFEVSGAKGSAVLSDWYRLRHGDEEIAPARADAHQVAEFGKLIAGEPNRLATFAEAAAVVEIVEGILAGGPGPA